MIEEIPVKIKKLRPDAIIPIYATEGAAGFDLHAYLESSYHVIHPGERELIQTGIAVQIPPGYEVQVRPRSGLALKRGITVLNTPGTIDSDYTGEIGVIIINHGDEPYRIEHKDRIAQGVIQCVPHAKFEVVDDLDETERGASGFGSTGVKEDE